MENYKNIFKEYLKKGIFPKIDFFKEADDDFFRWYKKIFEGSFLKDFIVEDLAEIFFHQFDLIILKRFQGEKSTYSFFDTEEDFILFLQSFAMRHQVDWNQKNNFLSFFTFIGKEKLRCTLIYTAQGPKMFLRKLYFKPLDLNAFCSNELLLKKIIEEKNNVLICGATSSGKTTLLSSLLNEVKEEHVIILEDHEEISYLGTQSTRLVGGQLEEIVPKALRMTPDRLILGEIRSYEVLSLQLILNTGHRGVLTTLHADSAVNALERLALLYTAYVKNLDYKISLKLFCQNLHKVIYLEKGQIKEVIEVLGAHEHKVIYEELKI